MEVESAWLEVIVKGLGSYPSRHLICKAKRTAKKFAQEVLPDAVLNDDWPDAIDDDAWAFQFCYDRRNGD